MNHLQSASTLILFLSIQFVAPTIWASASTCVSLFEDKETELYLNENPITHSDVEFFNKNNNIGLQYRGLLSFKQYSELSYREINKQPYYSVVGLTESGTLYHLITIGDRKLARKLSGKKDLAGFRLSSKGRLLAWDQNNNSYFFSETLWMRPTSKIIIKNFAKAWGLTSLGAVTILQVLKAYFWDPNMNFNIPIETFLGTIQFPLIETMFTFASGLSSGFAQLFRYEDLNNNPDGLIAVDVDHRTQDWLVLDMDHQNGRDFMIPDPNQLPIEMPKDLTEWREE